MKGESGSAYPHTKLTAQAKREARVYVVSMRAGDSKEKGGFGHECVELECGVDMGKTSTGYEYCNLGKDVAMWRVEYASQ